jgi:hypothetical protein
MPKAALLEILVLVTLGLSGRTTSLHKNVTVKIPKTYISKFMSKVPTIYNQT